MQEEGFLKVEAPIITSSDCEGGGEVFKVVDASPPSPSPSSSSSADHTPAPTPPPSRYLSVSSQLHLEAIASSHPRVYSLSPCFRAEKSDTARHLQEFWMLEAEVAFLSPQPHKALEQVMNLVEASVRSITRHVVEQAKEDFDYLASTTNGIEVGLRERTEGLLSSESYPRMTYSEAIRHLQEEESRTGGKKFVYKPEWGSSLQTEHEKYLAEELIKGPLFVTDYPTPLKPFYMLRNPSPSTSSSPASSSRSSSLSSSSPQDDSRATTACFDLLVPSVGELAGGSLRTHSPSDLSQAIERNPNLKEEDYEWYLDLRKYGTTRHGGFGLGWERLVGFLTGMKNVRECIAFPRAGEGSRF
jgi:asparaginyl-tRNA synthetase